MTITYNKTISAVANHTKTVPQHYHKQHRTEGNVWAAYKEYTLAYNYKLYCIHFSFNLKTIPCFVITFMDLISSLHSNMIIT